MRRSLGFLATLAIAALPVAAALAPLPALAASKNTARATGDLPIRSGPGTRYATIGTLRNGARVHLEQCTRTQNWCLFVDRSGEPVGWVRGSYLVGSPAKLEVTPSRLFDEPFGLFPRHRPFDRDRDDDWSDGFDD